MFCCYDAAFIEEDAVLVIDVIDEAIYNRLSDLLVLHDSNTRQARRKSSSGGN